jgi:hypothetical protein
MSKSVSYFDWKKSFDHKHTSDHGFEKEINSLGIPQDEFKDFMKKWKEKNFE